MGYFPEPVELTIGLKTVPSKLDKFPKLLLTKPSHDEENRTSEKTPKVTIITALTRAKECCCVLLFFSGFLYLVSV